MIFRHPGGQPVITATHMLESMTIHSRPTRRATDVANAILDGTDCLMLSGETAIGQYPVESVQMMADIAKYTETNRPRNMVADLLEEAMNKDEQIDQRDLLAVSINSAVRKLRPAIVFAPTVSGETARRVARFHLPIWIVAASPYEATAQRLQFTYGVCPEYLPMRPDNWEMYVRNWVQRNAVAGDLALLTALRRTIASGPTSWMIDLDDDHRPAVVRNVAVGGRRRYSAPRLNDPPTRSPCAN